MTNNHFLPFDISKNSDYHVKCVKAGFKRYVLVEIKCAGDNIDSNPDEPLFEICGSADYNAASPVMRQTLVKVVNEDLCELMPHITCPTLLIWGTADTATPLSDAVKMNSLMPESAIVKLEGAGHFSFLDQQPRFLRILASFLNVS